ncbi:RagB/SusD family nutrient uptake outer membrane protein [Aquimarina hainanensis]|uniref:RagB/SusD family nutrient uptake outer membrane protein n=1 Tax=Aquimarina hainanensis TaxID=1578017 RepID=UPI0036177027
MFSDQDLRKNASITTFNSQNIVNKYSESRNMPVVVSRMAEMYLISAEAQGFPSGMARLNQLRNIRGLASHTTITDQEGFIDAILDERQKEFYAEGFYWYDLVRTNKALERLENVTEQNQLLLPIPQREIDLTGIKQNPGY